jgi:CheY-like chemotaxis protein
MSTKKLVLLVEDNPGDARLITEAFSGSKAFTDLHVATDGAEGMAFLHQQGDHAKARRPDLILLDLNLPRANGLKVLAAVKGDEWLRTIPTVIITSSEAEADVTASYNLHANCFFTKPTKFEEFEDLVRVIDSFWLGRVRLPKAPAGTRPGTPPCAVGS